MADEERFLDLLEIVSMGSGRVSRPRAFDVGDDVRRSGSKAARNVNLARSGAEAHGRGDRPVAPGGGAGTGEARRTSESTSSSSSLKPDDRAGLADMTSPELLMMNRT
jgi:hypothetical protein